MSNIKPKVEVNTSTDLHLDLLADPTKIKPIKKNVNLTHITESDSDSDSHVVNRIENRLNKISESSERKSSNNSNSSKNSSSSRRSNTSSLSSSSRKSIVSTKPIELNKSGVGGAVGGGVAGVAAGIAGANAAAKPTSFFANFFGLLSKI